MKIFIFSLALLGCTLAFMPGKEYTYKYKGRMGMGIPAIKNTVSGTGIKCDVFFQISNGGNAMVKLMNVEVGEYLGDVECNLGTPMPIKYSPLQGYAKILEEPFEVHFKYQEGDVMVVPKSDLPWIVNLRKSISLMFFMEPLKMNFETYRIGAPLSDSFAQYEDTIHGNCKTEYTLMPEVGPMYNEHKLSMLKQMTEDVEFNEVSAEPMYKMVRNVDFSDCNDRVELVRAGFGNFSKVASNQYYNIKSRVSIGTFMMVGKPGAFRVQSGFIQGSTIKNAFGLNTEDKLTAITNQTITLMSVKDVKNPISITTPTKHIKTWFMEVASPFAPPANPVPWINYLSMPNAAYAPFITETVVTGIPITESDIHKFSIQLEKIMDEIATKVMEAGGMVSEKTNLWNTNEGVIMYQMDTATKLVPGIDVDTLQKMFDKLWNDKSEISQMKLVLFIDICAASGAGSPMKMLLNNFQNGKITNERITTIFMTLASHFTAVPLIPDLIKYVKTLDLKEKPFLTTMVWMNFATTLKKFCNNDPMSKPWTKLYFGNQKCNHDKVFDDLLDFFTQNLKTVETSWEKTVILNSMSNLGYPKALTTFKWIINSKNDKIVKRSAIYALSYKKMWESSRTEIFKILMPLVEDFTADTLLRQMALTTLFTWNPSPTFWQRIAVNSWKEPSKVMGAFIYQMMMENSHAWTSTDGNKVTHVTTPFLLPFTKPYWQSPSYSAGFFKSMSNKKEMIKTDFFLAILKEDKSFWPMDILHKFITTWGNAPFTMWEAAWFMDKDSKSPETVDINEQVKEFLPKNIGNMIGGSTSEKDMTQTIMEMIQKMMPMMVETGNMKQGNLFIQMFENLEFFAPLNIDTFTRAFVKDGVNFISSWLSGTNMHLTKYWNVQPVEIFTPTDLGLPLIEKSGMPILNNAEGTTKIKVPGVENPTIFDLLNVDKISFEFNSNYKFVYKTKISMWCIVPWSEKALTVGTQTMKNINMPGKLSWEWQFKNNMLNMTLGFTPIVHNPFIGVNLQNIPFVMIKNMYPGQSYSEIEKFQVITVKDNQMGQVKKVKPFDKGTWGLDGFTKWESDVSSPFTFGHMMDYFFMKPVFMTKLIFGPSPRLWSSMWVFDFAKAETKTIKTSMAFTWPLWSVEPKQNSIPKTMKFKDFNDESKYPHMFTLYWNTMLEGSINRFCEVSWKMISSKSSNKHTDILWSISKSAVPQYQKSSVNYCMKMTAVTPLVNDFQTFLNVLNNNKINMMYNGVLRGGNTCQDGEIASFKGQMKLSNDRKDKLVKELQEKCNFDVENPVASFKTAPVYDQISFKADFKQHFPDFAMNMTYQIYDWVKGYNFPHVYSNYMNIKNKPNSISFVGKRIMGEHKWKIRGELPRENIKFDKFVFPIVFDELVPLV